MKALAKGAILGGLAMFVWSSISWMVLDWHMGTFKRFENEAQVAEVLKANATAGAGIYLLPYSGKGVDQEAAMQKSAAGPFSFMSLRPGSKESGMGALMLKQFVADVLAALLVTILLLQMQHLSYGKRVVMATTTALAAGAMVVLPNWVWWEFSMPWTIVSMLDLLIGWTLAGLVIAWVAKDAPDTV